MKGVVTLTFMYAASINNGNPNVSVRRKSKTAISVITEKPLTDKQMEDLYWCVYVMHESGKTLRDLLKNDQN